MFELKGIYTPIATPYQDGKIAYDKMESNLNFWLGSKLEGLVLMGSNGEFVALREKEKEELIKFTCKIVKGTKKIAVGVGSNSIDETLHLCELSAEHGADAVLAITPFYYKSGMNDSILEQYFTELADKSTLPVILYNMPGNTGVNTSSALLSKLSLHKNIVGVKDTSGNIEQIFETIKNTKSDFSVFAGNWSFFLPSLYMGAKGATLALGNILPNECAKLMELYEKGSYEEARQLSFRLSPVNTAITAKYGIGGLKIAMEYVGLFGGEPRSPLRRPNEEARIIIKNILIEAGVEIKS